jgi:AraC-like DNA-binding protein
VRISTPRAVFELIDLLARTPEKKILASPGYAPTLDKRTLGVVHNNLSGTVRMSEAAAIAGMTQSSFSRFFKKNTGANFVDYSRKLRIGRACKLLSDSRRPVTDICFEVGFSQGTWRDAFTVQAARESAGGADRHIPKRLATGSVVASSQIGWRFEASRAFDENIASAERR